MKKSIPRVNMDNIKNILSNVRSLIKKIFRRPDHNHVMIRFLKSRRLKVFFFFFFLIVGLIEFAIGAMIYGFSINNRVTEFTAKIIPFPAAIVNQDAVTVNKYEQEKKYIHHFYETTQQTGLDYKSIDAEILNQLIENKLISFQALKEGVRLSKSEVDTAINNIIVQNGGQEKVNKALDELYGLNLKQFRDLVETQLLREKVSDELIARITASHILIRVDNEATPDQVETAKAKVDEIKNEISGGLDFAEAAKKYSEDVGSAESGGSLDPFTSGEMVKEFSDMAFITPVGTISEPVRTEFGWHLIKVENKTGKINKSFNEWLDGIKNNSFIWKLV